MKGFSYLKIFDYPAIAAALALAVAAAFYAYSGSYSQANVIIQGREASWVFPLDAEEQLQVEGPLGRTDVIISGGEVWVSSSPCENQTCVSSGKIHNHAQWIACLPNLVFVRVEGEKSEDGIDAGTW